MKTELIGISLCLLTMVAGARFARGQEAQTPVRLPPIVVEGEPITEERAYSEKKARKEIQRTPRGVSR